MVLRRSACKTCSLLPTHQTCVSSLGGWGDLNPTTGAARTGLYLHWTLQDPEEKWSSRKGQASTHLWFHNPGRKWLPDVSWEDLLHMGGMTYVPYQAEKCPGHRAGKGQIHLLNIHRVDTGLQGVMAPGE